MSNNIRIWEDFYLQLIKELLQHSSMELTTEMCSKEAPNWYCY